MAAAAAATATHATATSIAANSRSSSAAATAAAVAVGCWRQLGDDSHGGRSRTTAVTRRRGRDLRPTSFRSDGHDHLTGRPHAHSSHVPPPGRPPSNSSHLLQISSSNNFPQPVPARRSSLPCPPCQPRIIPPALPPYSRPIGPVSPDRPPVQPLVSVNERSPGSIDLRLSRGDPLSSRGSNTSPIGRVNEGVLQDRSTGLLRSTRWRGSRRADVEVRRIDSTRANVHLIVQLRRYAIEIIRL